MSKSDQDFLIYVDTEDDLQSVLSCFKVNQISHIPVLNEKKIVGIVTKTDVVEYLYRILPDRGGETLDSLSKNILVKELMIQPIIEAQVTDSQQAILEKLMSHQVGSVLLKENDRVVGIVTESDMIQYLSRSSSDEDLSFSESVGMNVVQWLDKNGLFRISKALSDIGI